MAGRPVSTKAGWVRLEIRIAPEFARFLKITAAGRETDLSTLIETTLHEKFGPDLVRSTLANFPVAS